MLPVVLVNVAVVAVTAPENVVPPLLVSVMTFKAFVAPTAPVTEIIPVVFRVKLEVLAVVVPLIVLVKLIGAATPVPTVNVLLSAIVVVPKVI